MRPLLSNTRALGLIARSNIFPQSTRHLLNRQDLITTIVLPSLSPTMERGVVAEWRKRPGEAVRAGDILCDIDTDKASVGFEMQDECILAKILVEAHGGELAVGSPIALAAETEEEYSAFTKLSPEEQMSLVVGAAAVPARPAPAPAAALVPVPPPPAPAAPSASSSSHRMSPAARHMIQSLKLNPENIKINGSGSRSIITKEDVIRSLKPSEGPSSPPPSVPAAVVASAAGTDEKGFIDIPNNNVRKVIAKRLTESKLGVPHSYTVQECKIDALLKFRKSMKKDFDVNISVNDLIIKAAALALRDIPAANSRFDPKTGMVRAPIQSPGGGDQIDISVAVATPTGLITPIVFGADRRGLGDISRQVRDLAGRAKEGKLKPEEYQGGSFTISNLGMFGISEFTAVINPPQACILAVGGGIERVVVKGASPAVETSMTVQMSSDRRVVDDQTAARFLKVFSSYLENPNRMLL